MSVPESRIALVQAGGDGVDVTAIGRAVRGATWIDAAYLQSWLAGRGSMDVPAHAPLAELDEGDSSEFRYWVKPRFQTARYAYHLSLTASVAGIIPPASVTIDGITSSVPVGTRASPIPVTLFRDRASLSATEAELAITIESAEGGGVITVECIAVEAVPRTELLVTDDLGANRLDYLARLPIDEATFSAELLANQAALRQACRRAGMFQFSRGTLGPWTSASAVSANLFAASFPLLGRKLFDGQTSTTSGVTKWRALAMCSDGSTAGTLTLTGGATVTIPTSTTAWTWITGTSFSHDCEDNSTADGYQAATPDDHQIAFVRTAGSGTVSVASVSFYDIGE